MERSLQAQPTAHREHVSALWLVACGLWLVNSDGIKTEGPRTSFHTASLMPEEMK